MEMGKTPVRACGKNEEVFILSPKGAVTHLLPGEACPPPDAGSRELRFQRKTKIWLPVGAGGLRDRIGNTWGGFCMIFCTLLLPRRFVLQNRERLLPGEPPEQILAEKMREILRVQIADHISRPDWNGSGENLRSLWEGVRITFENALRGTGWEMTAFRPESLKQTGR